MQSRTVIKDATTSAQESLAATIVAEARKRLPAALQDKATMIVGHQDPRHGILVAARQWSAGLIVMGARGLGPFKRLLLGSVSRAVVHASEISVWVARPRARNQEKLQVLLASESPETAKPLADLLARLSWPNDTGFTVLTVVYSLFAGRVPDWLQQQARSADVEEMVQTWVREHDDEISANRERIKQFVANLSPPLHNARPLVREGDTAESILETATSEKSDLIVIGTRKRWSIGNAIVGSVSEAVLNHATCSVLVVPQVETP
jgi:nucleotide-binding universal stress UspA family protein